jgi:hypothetical protein
MDNGGKTEEDGQEMESERPNEDSETKSDERERIRTDDTREVLECICTERTYGNSKLLYFL